MALVIRCGTKCQHREYLKIFSTFASYFGFIGPRNEVVIDMHFEIFYNLVVLIVSREDLLYASYVNEETETKTWEERNMILTKNFTGCFTT